MKARYSSWWKTAASGMTATAVFATLAWNSAYLTFVFQVDVQPDWRLSSFAPVADYLAPALEAGDYGLLSKRSAAARDRLAELGFAGRLDPAFDSFDPALVSAACADSAVAASDGPLSQYCESVSVSAASASSVQEDCSVLRFERNRKDCRESNDLKFSTVSDSHCSKSECVVDNAVFRALVSWTPPCADVPAAMSSECRRIDGEFEKYRSNSGSFIDRDLESAISWKTADPILLAARYAVLDNPDSPSSACAEFKDSQARACESRVKSLFSYVQTKALRERFERISAALEASSIRKTEPVSK